MGNHLDETGAAMKYGAPVIAPFQAVGHGIRIEKKSE